MGTMPTHRTKVETLLKRAMRWCACGLPQHRVGGDEGAAVFPDPAWKGGTICLREQRRRTNAQKKAKRVAAKLAASVAAGEALQPAAGEAQQRSASAAAGEAPQPAAGEAQQRAASAVAGEALQPGSLFEKAAAERERKRKKRDSLAPASVPDEPEDLDALSTQQWTADEPEGRERERTEIEKKERITPELAALKRLLASIDPKMVTHGHNNSWRDHTGKFVRVPEKKKRVKVDRCSTCGLLENTCKCDYFPMCMPNGLGFGDKVRYGEQVVYALYFAPVGTAWSPSCKPWYSKIDLQPAARLHEDSIICLPEASDRVHLGDLFVAPVSKVRTHYEVIDGRVRRPPSRYEPERLRASRAVSVSLRLRCFRLTIGGRHCCFSCGMTLCSSMAEELRINANPRTAAADHVRTVEAGHVHAHARGGPDELWNLIPLCHSCNCQMQVNLAFDWIESRRPAPAHVNHPDYIARKQCFIDKSN